MNLNIPRSLLRGVLLLENIGGDRSEPWHSSLKKSGFAHTKK
jgi:hypothetical protein